MKSASKVKSLFKDRLDFASTVHAPSASMPITGIGFQKSVLVKGVMEVKISAQKVSRCICRQTLEKVEAQSFLICIGFGPFE